MKPIQRSTTLCPLPSPLTMCRKRKNFQFHCSRRCRRPQRRRRLKYSRSEEGGGGIFCAFIVVIPLQEGHRLCYGDLKILEKGTYILAKIKEETCTFCTNISTQCYLRYAIPLILLRSCFKFDQDDPKENLHQICREHIFLEKQSNVYFLNLLCELGNSIGRRVNYEVPDDLIWQPFSRVAPPPPPLLISSSNPEWRRRHRKSNAQSDCIKVE